jgi:hypothetical protein
MSEVAEWMSATIRSREEEVAELIEEIKAMEWTETALLDAIATRDRALNIQGQRIGILHTELAEYRATRTLGGPHHGYTPTWKPGETKDDRDTACIEQWPDCRNGDYDPRCCRFPKSCSC